MKILPKKFIQTLITGLTLSIVLSVITVAVAQEIQRTITIINPAIQLNLNPGEHAEGTTAIINDGTSQLTFKIGIQDYIVVDKMGTPNLLPPGTLAPKYSAAAWIGVYPSTVTVKPGQRVNINYYVNVPPNATACGHYAAIVYSPVAQSGQGTGSSVNTELGSLFYITVNGKCSENAKVTKFSSPGFQEYGPVNIETEIKNNGDLHIRPTGTITLSGLFANNTYKFPEDNIFPQTARDFENTVGQELMLGRYKAVLLASYGVNNNLPLTATLYFWVFPWRLALIIVLVIVALILAIMYYKKRKKENSNKHHGANDADETQKENEPETKTEVSESPKTETDK